MNLEQLKQTRTKLYEKAFNSSIKKLSSKPIGQVGRLVYNLNEKISNQYKIHSIEECCSVTQISLYSIVNGSKVGDPICDKIIVKFFENAAVFILADGCGWGTAPLQAANTACTTISFKMNELSKCKTIQEIAKLEIAALQEGDQSILSSMDTIKQCGTTTIMIITIVPFENHYLGVYVNVGDCACFKYRNSEEKTKFVCGKLIDTIKDATQCGGRIGNAKNGLPSLEELSVGKFEIETDDLVMVMTDGVHHNLNPNVRHISYDCSIEESECQLLGHKIFMSDTICDISENIMGEIINLTNPSRDFHEKFPKKKLPLDIPGKLDHATFGVIKVGSWIQRTNFLVNSIIPSFYDDLLPNTSETSLISPKKLPIRRKNSERQKSVFKTMTVQQKSPRSSINVQQSSLVTVNGIMTPTGNSPGNSFDGSPLNGSGYGYSLGTPSAQPNPYSNGYLSPYGYSTGNSPRSKSPIFQLPNVQNIQRKSQKISSANATPRMGNSPLLIGRSQSGMTGKQKPKEWMDLDIEVLEQQDEEELRKKSQTPNGFSSFFFSERGLSPRSVQLDNSPNSTCSVRSVNSVRSTNSVNSLNSITSINSANSTTGDQSLNDSEDCQEKFQEK